MCVRAPGFSRRARERGGSGPASVICSLARRTHTTCLNIPIYSEGSPPLPPPPTLSRQNPWPPARIYTYTYERALTAPGRTERSPRAFPSFPSCLPRRAPARARAPHPLVPLVPRALPLEGAYLSRTTRGKSRPLAARATQACVARPHAPTALRPRVAPTELQIAVRVARWEPPRARERCRADCVLSSVGIEIGRTRLHSHSLASVVR